MNELTIDQLTERFYNLKAHRDRLLWAVQFALKSGTLPEELFRRLSEVSEYDAAASFYHFPKTWNFTETLAFRKREQPDLRFVEGEIHGADGKFLCEIGPVEEPILRRILSAVNFCAGTDSEYLDGAGNLGLLLKLNEKS